MRKHQLCLRIVLMVWSIYFLGFGAMVAASVVIRGDIVGSVVGRIYLALLLGSVCSTLLLVFLGGNEAPGISGSSRGESFPPPQGGSPPRPPDAGRPVPVKPSPKHHLVAAKALPPSEKTHCLPKDLGD